MNPGVGSSFYMFILKQKVDMTIKLITIIAKPNIMPNLKTLTSLCQANGENTINAIKPKKFNERLSLPETVV